MPISLLTHTGNNTGATFVVTSPIDTTGASLLVVAIGDNAEGTMTWPSDSEGNHWTQFGAGSLWTDADTPSTVDTGDDQAINLGMRFQSSAAGLITAIRFYKSSTNIETHVGSIWANDGTLLGQVTFANESASGWQQQSLDRPVSIAANTTYVVSYYAPRGDYSADSHYFASSHITGPLTALADGTDGASGVYDYGSGAAFPTSTFNSTNYWVDVVFVPATALPPSIANQVSAALFYCANPTTSASHTFQTDDPDYPAICVAAFADTAVAPADQTSQATATDATTIQPGSITPAEGNELVITAVCYEVLTVSINGAFTITDQVSALGGTSEGLALAYLIQTSAAAVNPTWTAAGSPTLGGSNDLAVVMATFKSLEGGGGGGGGGDSDLDLVLFFKRRRREDLF